MWYGIGNTGVQNPSTARIEMQPDGRVTLYTGCADIGQGSTTVLVQIAAETLGIKPQAIDAVVGDTKFTTNAGATSASRQTYISGNAVKDAAQKLADVLLTEAVNKLRAPKASLIFDNGDVAVAVAIEGGLFTPVLRDCHTKTLSALSAEMKDLAGRARDRKLAPHEYQGGTFAISNLGMFGIENFDAVINPPHGSILAVGAGAKKPVVDDNGEIAIKTVMSVTLSVDHRVIDGALGAQFLQAIKSYLEEPLSMLA
jgi:pyruvate dehydrogenase E2 component (dihydrolipoamide acetyltransferase)